MCVRFSVRFDTQSWISVNEAFPAFYLTGYIQYINMCCVTKLWQQRVRLTHLLCRVHSTARREQSLFYSCCLWISVDRGAVVTYGEVSINKLRLKSFTEMLLYCILTTKIDASVCLCAKFDQFLPVRSHFDTKRPVNYVRIATFQCANFGPLLFAFYCPLLFYENKIKNE